MAKITEKVAIVVGAQSAAGTINASVRDATIVANIDDGASLSAGEALGILYREDSLALDFERLEDAAQVFSGTFSKGAGSFLRSRASDFSFDVTAKGSGQTLDDPITAGKYDLPAAIRTLLSGAGMLKGSSGSTETPYALGEPVYLTFKVWRGAVSYTLQDCTISDISWKLDPSNVVVITFTVAPGAIIKNGSDTFPTSISYGLQESTTAPILQLAGASIGGVTRGFLDGTLSLTLDFEEFKDSNVLGGVVQEMSGRTVSWNGSFYVDSSDPDQDYDNLIRTGSFPDLSFILGAHTEAEDAIANAVLFTLQNMNFTSVKYDKQAGRVVFALEGYATHAGAGNDEFAISSR